MKLKIMDRKRYFIKGGNTFNNQEPFNEIIATKLFERILDEDEYVRYDLIQENDVFYSCCQTMVNTDEELVSAYYIDSTIKLRGHDSLYNHYILSCNTLGIPDAKLKIDKMLVCDYILANYDCHHRNFGAIRNIVDLKWRKVAPIYDSGSSLWATSATQFIGADYKSKPFLSNPDKQLDLVDDLFWLNADALIDFDKIVYEVFSKNPLMDEERILAIASQVKNRIKRILELKKEKS